MAKKKTKKSTKATKNPIKRLNLVRTIDSKARFLSVFIAKANNISESCKAAAIDRGTYYQWIAKDLVFKSAVAEAQEALYDFAETALMKAIQDGNFQAIKFYLINKAKDRGWQETTNIAPPVGVAIQIIHHYIKPPLKKKEK